MTPKLLSATWFMILCILANWPSAAHAFESGPTWLTVSWTAPGDDGTVGKVAAYDLRYATSPISEANWNSAISASVVPAPGDPGSTESCTITELQPAVTYYMAVISVDSSGNWSDISNIVSATTSIILGADDGHTGLPTDFQLSQNYPNPFNASTQITYSLPRTTHVNITVFNVAGQQVTTIVDDLKPAGNHAIVWEGYRDDGNPLSSGIYFYRIQAGNFLATKKMILLK
jgi:hypothetical protein